MANWREIEEIWKMVDALTDDQVTALNHFEGVNRPGGKVWFEGRWLYRHMLKEDAALAARYVSERCADEP